jgi:cobalt-zinc-cadmium efflux system outer membrane protein
MAGRTAAASAATRAARTLACVWIAAAATATANADDVPPSPTASAEGSEEDAEGRARALGAGRGASGRARGRVGAELTLDEAVARALARAPEAVVGARAVEAAAASRVGAALRVSGNPRISGDFRPNLDRNLDAAPGFGAMAEVRLDVFGAPGARVDEANRRVGLATAELEVARLDARLGAIAAYVRVQLAEEYRAASDELLRIAERVLGAVRERIAAGAASDIDLTSAELAVADARAERAEAEAARLVAYRELATLLDLDPDERPALVTPVAALPEPPSEAALSRASARSHPDVAAIDARAALLEATSTRLARELAPQIGVYAGLDQAPASPLFGLLGLSIELPVFQRNQGPRAVADAERAMEEARGDLVARRIARDLWLWRDAYVARRDAAAALDAEAVPAATRRLALVEEGWRLGRLDIFRVTTARDDLLRVRARRIAALGEAWSTWLALERAMGAGR